ncbi:MAG: DUF4235 domain-containing protein [Solirubrobacteraceae bacterium]
MKLIYKPISILAGLIAGLLGRKIFRLAWARVDDAEPPKPDESGASWGKLLGALLLQGAVFTVVRGAVDHACRRGFAALTGSWPGDPGRSQGEQRH